MKIFYQRDYQALLVKYGLEPPSQAMPADETVEPLPLRFDDVEAAPPRPRRRRLA
ncbi:MAG: hypothetical protein JO085_07750 [Acidimicrobiia bacterium]|nr:hypothetical protein [Acidimicrobiia bacterium]